MRTRVLLSVSMLTAVVLLAGGCAPGPRGDGPSVVRLNSAAAEMAVPDRTVHRGQVLGVGIATWNLGKEPLTVTRTGSSVYRVEAARHDGIGWVTFRTYPATDAMVLRKLTLEPGSRRDDSVLVTVEPDWPGGEVVRLQAVMNGWPELRMSDFVTVRP